MKFSVDGGAVVPGYAGAGWQLDPGQVRAVLGGLDEDLGALCQDAGRLNRAVATVTAPALFGAAATWSGPPVLVPELEDYHGLAEWGLPFGGAVVCALDEALYAQTARINQVVGAVCAAVVGVSQAADAYEAGAEEMAATIQAAAADAARTGDFSWFGYLDAP